MKHFLQTALMVISIFTCVNSASAQSCVPNNDTVPGITPDTLDIAYVGVPYQQVIYFRLPHDTSVVFGNYVIPIVIDSLLIDSATGLPPTFSFGCNAFNCVVYGGSNGCATIYGTADTADMGIHPLQVFVTTFISDTAGAPAGFVHDTVTTYFLDVDLATGIPPFASGNNFSAGKVFPNPALNGVSIPFYLPQQNQVTISVFDLEGRVCFQNSLMGKHGFNITPLDISLLSEGSYFIQIESSGRRLFTRMQVQRD